MSIIRDQKEIKKDEFAKNLSNFTNSLSLFEFLQWDIKGGVNLFAKQTAYESLPYLLNFRNEGKNENRRILIETTDSLFN